MLVVSVEVLAWNNKTLVQPVKYKNKQKNYPQKSL